MAIPSNDAVLAALKGAPKTTPKIALPSHAEIVQNLGGSYSALPKPQMTNFSPLDVQPFQEKGTMGTKTFADYTPAIQNAPPQIKEGIDRMILADTEGNIIPKPVSFKDTVFSDIKRIWTEPLHATKPFTPVNYLTDLFGPAGTAGEGGLVGDIYKAWQKVVDQYKATGLGDSPITGYVTPGIATAGATKNALANKAAIATLGLDAIDAFFTPVSSALQRAATYKGIIGGEADFFNRIFQSVGTIGGDSLAGMVQATPLLTQDQKDVAAPIMQRIGALAAQIMLGKATEGTFTEMKNATHDMLSKTLDLYKKSSVRERQLGAIKNPFAPQEEGKPKVPPEIIANAEKIAVQLGIKQPIDVKAKIAEKAQIYRGEGPGSEGGNYYTFDRSVAEGHAGKNGKVVESVIPEKTLDLFSPDAKVDPVLNGEIYDRRNALVAMVDAKKIKIATDEMLYEPVWKRGYDAVLIRDDMTGALNILLNPKRAKTGVPEGVQEAEIVGIAAAENNQPPKVELKALHDDARKYKTAEEFVADFDKSLTGSEMKAIETYKGETTAEKLTTFYNEATKPAEGVTTRSVRTVEEAPALESQIKDIVGEEQLAKIPKLEEQIASLKKEMETAVGDARDAVLEELNAATRERNTIQNQVRDLQERIRTQANLYTKGNAEMNTRFLESGGQKKLTEVHNRNFEIGDWAAKHDTDKGAKGDRFSINEVVAALKNSFTSVRASADPTVFRHDNIAWLSKTNDGFRVVYTRKNASGADEVVGWHKISKSLDSYLEKLGVSAGIRTQIATFEESKTNPLSYKDHTSIARGEDLSREATAPGVPEDVLKKAAKDWQEDYAERFAKLDTAGQLKLEQEFKDKWEPLAKPQTIQDNLPDVPGIETPAETFAGAVPPAEHRSFNSLIGDFFRGLKGVAKVHFLDYLKTPEFVLEKLGLGKEAQMLHDANDVYRSTLKKEVSVVQGWKDRVDESLSTHYRLDESGKYVEDVNGLTISPQEASKIIHRYLDGEELGMKSQMNPTMYQVAREIREYLKQWADRLKLPEEGRVSRYITRLFDTDVTRPGFEETMDPELAAIMRDKVAGSVYDPFLQRRLGMQGYKQDVWASLDAYVKRGSRKEAFDPALEALDEAAKKLPPLSYDYVKKFSHLVNMRPTELDKLVDSFVKQSPLGGKLGERPVARVTQKLRQAYYRGFLGLNPASALRNLSQGANTYAKLGEKYTTIGYIKIFSKMMRRDLQELYDQNILDDAFIQDRKIGVYKTAVQKLDPVLFSMFDTAEKINRGAAYFGAKEKYLAQGMSEEKAIQAAKRIVRETQFAFGRVDTPVALNQDIIKVFTQLGTYNIKQIEFLTRMVKNKEFAGIIRYTGASILFWATIGKLFGMTLQQLIPSVGLGNAPAVSTAMNVATAVNPSTNAKDRAAAQKKVATGFLGLIPGGLQARKTFQGGQAMGEGKSIGSTGKVQYNIAQTPTNFVRALLFGKSALPEAQESFSTGDELQKGLDEQKAASAQLGLEAEQKWTELKDLKTSQGPEAAKTEWNQIAKDNPLLLDRIKQIAKDEELGLDANDRKLKMYGVANGARAKYIADEINALKTKAEKQALWRSYVTKKIITPEVAKQIEPLLK